MANWPLVEKACIQHVGLVTTRKSIDRGQGAWPPVALSNSLDFACIMPELYLIHASIYVW